MDLVELRWKTMIDNEKPEPEKEAELRAFLDREFEEYWKKWRAKTYVLSEEEMKAELGRSFPIQKADIFKRKERDTDKH